ncbi:hypothetical protein IAT40_001080 [Kwoniella sp. CBS 6097]
MATSAPIHPPPPTRDKQSLDDPYTSTSTSGPGAGEQSMPTPSLSGPTTPLQPETPHTIQLQTPSTTIEMDQDHTEPSASASGSRATSPSRDAVEAFGWVEKGNDNGKGKGRAVEADVSSTGDIDVLRPSDESDGVDAEGSILDVDGLRRIRDRIAVIEGSDRTGDGWSQRDDLLSMTKSLLSATMEELQFLHERVAAQQDTIRTMQQQAKLSEQLMQVERQRHLAERQSWHAETRALVHAREAEIAAGTRQRRVLDLDVGYHQELEASNKRLEMDNRLMAPRLADTQRQIDKLVNELRILRSHVILHSQPISEPRDGQTHTQAQSQAQNRHSRHLPPLSMMPLLPGSASGSGRRKKSRSPIKGSGKTTMGDARAEHLLLAAKRVRTMRQVDERVGRLTLEELKKNGVVGPDGGVGYTEGYGRGESEAEDEDSELEEKPVLTHVHARRPSTSVKGKGKSQSQSQGTQAQGSPLLPRVKRSGKRPTATQPAPPPMPQTPSKSSRKQPPPQTTPGGSNFNDLLRAAEMATRPGTPTPEDHSQIVPFSTMSATRSTTRARDESASERGSPVKRARREEWSSGREDDMPAPTQTHSQSQTQQSIPPSQQSASALDLLAQASQLEVAQSGDMSSSSSSGPSGIPPPPPLQSAARLGGMMRGSSPSSIEEPSLGPAIDLTAYSRAKVSAPFTGTSIQPQPSAMEEQQQIDPSLTTPKGRARAYSNASELATPMTGRAYASSQVYPTPGGESLFGGEEGGTTPRTDVNLSYASPTGGTVPGLGKYVHLTSSMPARRVRSPYLKWTVEEDELLARAVAIHGEKWDLVSKGVPTRSYHQVRQRWLRKTGAFDKKPQGDDVKGEVVQSDMGVGNGDGNEGSLGAIGEGGTGVEDDESPTPSGGGSKKRRKSQSSA